MATIVVSPPSVIVLFSTEAFEDSVTSDLTSSFDNDNLLVDSLAVWSDFERGGGGGGEDC